MLVLDLHRYTSTLNIVHVDVLQLDLYKIVSICADGASVMQGQNWWGYVGKKWWGYVDKAVSLSANATAIN